MTRTHFHSPYISVSSSIKEMLTRPVARGGARGAKSHPPGPKMVHNFGHILQIKVHFCPKSRRKSPLSPKKHSKESTSSQKITQRSPLSPEEHTKKSTFSQKHAKMSTFPQKNAKMSTLSGKHPPNLDLVMGLLVN